MRVMRLWGAAAALAVMAAVAPAQVARQRPDMPERSFAGSLREYQYQRMLAEIQNDFDAGENEKAAAACERVLKLYPDDAGTRYNLACADARLKKPEAALADLALAVESGWDETDHMMEDEDLAPIRNDKRFAPLVAATHLNERAGGAKYEKGEVIAGVKTVEDFPDGGLRFRIRIPPDATAEKPARLVIWLHPSGVSMNAQIEKMAPEFAAHGYALMVFTHKQFDMWTTEEADALVKKTLPALRAYKQIDAERPVLLGYGAGGQMALSLWAAKPGAWSGLILDEAYPLQLQSRDMGLKDIELPASTDSLKKTPLFVAIGANDRAGTRRWDLVENKWLAAGIPLTVTKVAGKGHAWLLTDTVLKQAFGWLDDLKAGKLPADTAKPRELDM